MRGESCGRSCSNLRDRLVTSSPGLEPSFYPFDLEEFASKGDGSQGSLPICFRELGADPQRLLCDMAYRGRGDSFHTTPPEMRGQRVLGFSLPCSLWLWTPCDFLEEEEEEASSSGETCLVSSFLVRRPRNPYLWPGRRWQGQSPARSCSSRARPLPLSRLSQEIVGPALRPE